MAHAPISGTTIYVTSSNDSGSGTLREAIDTAGERTIVFTFGGTIELESPLVIAEPDCWIRGDMALGGGICLKNHTLTIETNHVIVQYMRVRLGSDSESSEDAIQHNVPASDVWLDHCSVSWASDECVDIYGASGETALSEITLSYCIISEGLDVTTHSAGIIACYATNITIHHCLIALNRMRFPLCSGRVDIYNNVIYAWITPAMQIRWRVAEGLDTNVNVIGNTYISGPLGASWAEIQVLDYGDLGNMQICIADNDHSDEVVDDWDNVAFAEANAGDESDYRTDTPHALILSGLEIDTAADAYTDVLANAGATLPKRDNVDAAVVAHVQAGTGTLLEEVSDSDYPDLAVQTPDQRKVIALASSRSTVAKTESRQVAPTGIRTVTIGRG